MYYTNSNSRKQSISDSNSRNGDLSFTKHQLNSTGIVNPSNNVGHQNGTQSVLGKIKNVNTPLLPQKALKAGQKTQMQQAYMHNGQPLQQFHRRNVNLNIITQGFKENQHSPPFNPQSDDMLYIEDYFAESDSKFIETVFVPYLKELYKDLLIKCNQVENIDKVTFIEYTKIPGIINDRLHKMFSVMNKDNQQSANRKSEHSGNSPGLKNSPLEKKEGDSPKKTPINLKNPKAALAQEYVTEQSFVENFTKIFVGDIDTKMRFTFKMYDFDNDNYITAEDIRIMLSYMPFQRYAPLQAPQKKIEQRIQREQQHQLVREGLWQDEEGKNLTYQDRVSDQEDIKQFLEKIFQHANSFESSPVPVQSFQQLSKTLQGKRMNYQQYEYVNQNVSSEMFYSLMSILHEKLPCAKNFYRLRNKFRSKDVKYKQAVMDNSSPIRTLASPKLIRGLSISKKAVKDDKFNSQSHSPDIRIKSSKNPSNMMRKMSSNNSFEQSFNQTSFLNGMMSPDMNVNIVNQNSNFNKTMTGNNKFINNQNQQFRPFNYLSPSNNQFNGQSQPQSPHKLNKMNKFTRYEESKQDQGSASTLSHSMRISQNNLNYHNKNPQSVVSLMSNGGKNPIKAVRHNEEQGEHRGSIILLDDSPVKSPENQQSNHSSDSNSGPNSKPVQPLQGFGNYQDHAKDNIIFESECLLKTKTDRYKKHWAFLTGNEIYCYKQREDIEKGEQHKVMHSLIGTFVKEMPAEMSQSEACLLYPVKIVLPPNKSRLLYFKSESQQQEWSRHLKNTIGHNNMFDFYDFKGDLGKGQFGLVKLATHKQNGQKVAIKTVNKKDMKQIEIYQQRREIEVLKMSQHPNIVGLIDLFENSEFYYIVLEYMQGGDLFDYIQARKFSLNENRVKELAYQIGLAVKHLHSYGIVHRDLKLENVMMSDNTEESIPKLVDFGLAKMIGPNETALEPFGTLGYVAPEVLKKQPYSTSCDLWSFGCIMYALLSGSLPFDHESQRETINMTLNKQLEFDLPCWKNHSNMVKDLLTKLLTKDPKLRITLDSALNHPWFKDVDLNPKTGTLNNRLNSKSFKQKKLGIISNNSSCQQSLNVSYATES